MCLILFSLDHHPRYPLIIAANRDEAYHRPSAPLAFWEESPRIAAGRDLEAGGTWLGMTREGRWAALTNHRQPGGYRRPAPSRGRLVSSYLEGNLPPGDYLTQLERTAHEYNGFNLLVGIGSSAFYLSNLDGPARKIPSGVHGLSNHLLDTPWPKVEVGTRALRNLAQTSAEAITQTLLETLGDRVIPPDASLPETGVGFEHKRALSPPFIASDYYGTRASTVVLVDDCGHVSMVENLYGPFGVPQGSSTLAFSLESASVERPTIATNPS